MLSMPDAETRLKELNARRKPLAERFERDPTAIHLAVQIKVLDDQIAEFTRQIRDNRKNQKPRLAVTE
jgi:hypothetical protein